MNKRAKKKQIKTKLNTPTKFLCTGGFLTPYACPNPVCHTRFSLRQALEYKECPECSQKLMSVTHD